MSTGWTWEEERFSQEAVKKLIDAHYDEYLQYATDEKQEQIDDLLRLVERYKNEIARLQALNPDGLNAEILAKQVAIVQKAVDRKPNKRS